jgi:Tfp pilus assembly protein PilN
MQKMSKQNAHVRRVFVGVAPQEQPTTFAENVAQEPKEARTNLPKKTRRHGKFKKTGNQNATMSKKLQNELFEKEKAEFDLILRGFEATHDRVAHDCSTMFQQVSEFSKTSKKVLENLEATRRFHSRIFDFEVASLPDAWRENGKKVFSDSIRQHSSNRDEFIPSAKEDFFYPVLERLGAATGKLNQFQSKVAEINQSISYLKNEIRGPWNDARIALQASEGRFANCYKDQFIGPIVGKNRLVNDFSRPTTYSSMAARQQEARTRLREIQDSHYGSKSNFRRQKPRFMTTERACATNVSISDAQVVPTSDTPTADLIDLSDPLAIFEDASTASTVSRLLNVTQRTTNLSASNDRIESDPAPRIIVEDASTSQQDEDAETISLAESLFLPPATRHNANTTDSIIEWLRQFHPTVA